MIETKQSAKIIKILRENFKAEVLNVHGSSMQMPSWPDCYISHPRYVGFVEWKGKDTPIQEDQKITIRKLYETGSTVFIVRFLSEDHYEFLNYELETLFLLELNEKDWIKKTRAILNTLEILKRKTDYDRT